MQNKAQSGLKKHLQLLLFLFSLTPFYAQGADALLAAVEKREAAERNRDSSLASSTYVPPISPLRYKGPDLSCTKIHTTRRTAINLIMDATKNDPKDYNKIRGALYDLLNPTEPISYPVCPDELFIEITEHTANMKYTLPLLGYAVLCCNDNSIIRLLAEKSSRNTKEDILYNYGPCSKAIVAKISHDDELVDPYFSYFFNPRT